MRDQLVRAKNIYTDGIGGDFRQSILEDLDDMVQEIHAELEYCKPADCAKLQGKLQGIRECRAKIRGTAWDEKMADAQAAIEDFEEKNALFLGEGELPASNLGAARIALRIKDHVADVALGQITAGLYENSFMEQEENSRIYIGDFEGWDDEEIAATMEWIGENKDALEIIKNNYGPKEIA